MEASEETIHSILVHANGPHLLVQNSVPRFMYQRTAGSRAGQLAAIPFELTIHDDVLHAPRHLVRIGIGCGVKNRSWVEDGHISVEAALQESAAGEMFALRRQ